MAAEPPLLVNPMTVINDLPSFLIIPEFILLDAMDVEHVIDPVALTAFDTALTADELTVINELGGLSLRPILAVDAMNVTNDLPTVAVTEDSLLVADAMTADNVLSGIEALIEDFAIVIGALVSENVMVETQAIENYTLVTDTMDSVNDLPAVTVTTAALPSEELPRATGLITGSRAKATFVGKQL